MRTIKRYLKPWRTPPHIPIGHHDIVDDIGPNDGRRQRKGVVGEIGLEDEE